MVSAPQRACMVTSKAGVELTLSHVNLEAKSQQGNQLDVAN